MKKRKLGKSKAGSLGDRTRLHGNELVLRTCEGQAGHDCPPARLGGAWRHILRYSRSVWPVSERRAGR